MLKKMVRVAVTGAAGNIGYALLFRIASGQMFGPETRIHLNLLEIETALPALKGVVMEMEDCAFPLVASVRATVDPSEAFWGADWALLIGSVPRKAGMERGDLLKINGKIFTRQGQAISENAQKDCKVLVVGNPCNTNAYIAKAAAKNIPERNFFAMTMLDQNRAYAQLAQKAGGDVSDIRRMVIWGNHSATQYPDFYNATIGGRPAVEVIGDEDWLKDVFIPKVQQRGSEILKARGASSAASAANAVVDAVRSLINPTDPGEMFSMAVCSDGSYGIEKGVMFSYPVRSNGKEWEIVQGIRHNEYGSGKIALTHEELILERDAVSEIL